MKSDDDGTAILTTDRTDGNYQKTGDLITLPYTEKTLIDQPFASKFVNVNPFNVFTWVGSVELDRQEMNGKKRREFGVGYKSKWYV